MILEQYSRTAVKKRTNNFCRPRKHLHPRGRE